MQSNVFEIAPERRSEPRLMIPVIKVFGTVSFLKARKQTPSHLYVCSDISMDGMGVITTLAPPIDAAVQFSIRFGQHNINDLTGMVVSQSEINSHERRLGIKFTRPINARQKRRIEAKLITIIESIQGCQRELAKASITCIHKLPR